MSSVKKIAKSPKSKAVQAKAEAAKSGMGRGRTAKRSAEPSSKKARVTATRTVAARPKAKTPAKGRVAVKAKAATKPARTSAARSAKASSAKTVRAPARIRGTKAKTVPSTRSAAKVAPRKAAARPAAKSAVAVGKAATAKRGRNTAGSIKAKQSESAGLARAKTGVASAARMVPTKAAAAAEPRRAKAAGAAETVAVAKKAASKLAAHPEVRLALRPLPGQAAASPAPRGAAPAKGQTVAAAIEIGGQRPVIQKIQKKVPAAPSLGAVAPVTAHPAMAKTRAAMPVQAEAEKTPAAPPSKPQPVVKEIKAAEVEAAEAKPVERPGAAAKPAKPPAAKQGFKPTEYIVYPAHGVGQIMAVEEQEVAGFKLELYVISFVKDKMILKVPTPKSVSVGMRKLAGPEVVKRALDTLTGRARIKRTMWSRRAQEYEAKINSGDLVAIAEVVRDLYRSDAQPEQSYSERQLYEAALDRVAREIAVVHKLTETESLKLIEAQLQKGPRRGKGEDADAAAAEAEDGDIDEAA